MSLIEQTLCLVHTFSNRHLFVETLPRLFIFPFSPFFKKMKILLTSLHIISFCTIVLQVEFVGVLRSVPLRRKKIRYIMGDDCPLSSVQVEGPNSSQGHNVIVGLGSTFSFVCFCTAASGLFFLFLVFERTEELHSYSLNFMYTTKNEKTNLK